MSDVRSETRSSNPQTPKTTWWVAADRETFARRAERRRERQRPAWLDRAVADYLRTNTIERLPAVGPRGQRFAACVAPTSKCAVGDFVMSGKAELSGNRLEVPVRPSGGLDARKDDHGNERDDDGPEPDRERLNI